MLVLISRFYLNMEFNLMSPERRNMQIFPPQTPANTQMFAFWIFEQGEPKGRITHRPETDWATRKPNFQFGYFSPLRLTWPKGHDKLCLYILAHTQKGGQLCSMFVVRCPVSVPGLCYKIFAQVE